MDKGDIISILAALIIVSLVAVITQSPVAEPEPEIPISPTPEVPPPPTPPPPPTSPPSRFPEPFRISYSTDFWDRPLCYLPDNLTAYGASDPPWKDNQGIIPFASIEENRGGITEVFHVPYAVWRLNCNVSATVLPEAARFRMALVDLESGAIVKGAEMRYPGSIIKNSQIGGKDFYLIVSVDDISSYSITLETLEEYL